MSELVACTIIANNYLAYARTFTRSVLAQHPGARVYALIVDRRRPELDYGGEPFIPVFVEELGIRDFAHLAFRYSILELNTAVKPSFLQFLHRRHGAERVLYFDPDILVLGDLSTLWAELAERDVLLTPHVTAPLEDARTPSEQDFLLSGIYNLGFLGIAFNERTLPFLDWWAARLHTLCLHEVWRGLFVDQRWMDFAPAFIERFGILRDPGYNAAYWNLAHRTLAQEGGAWRVNGQPLRFFHFSGFSLEHPTRISKFQNRFTAADRPDLAPLFADYAARLTAAGHQKLKDLPYGFGSFDNGAAIPPAARRALRATDLEAARWKDPFRTNDRDSFFSWLRQPVASSFGLPRIAMALWDQRADLQGAFPAPLGGDGERYCEWLRSPSGMAELEPRWLEGVRSSSDGAAAHPSNASRAAPLAADPGSPLPLLALQLHRTRFDLQLAFPEPLSASLTSYAEWFVTYARLEYRLSAKQVAPAMRVLPARRRWRARLWWLRQRSRRRPEPIPERARVARPPAFAATAAPAESTGPRGVNVLGWASAPTGVGEACRGSLAALRAAGIPHSLRDLGTPLVSPPAPAAAGDPPGLPYDLTLYHVNADMMPHIARMLPSSLQAGRYRIGYWFWELSHFPLQFAGAFERLDEVWAPTSFCVDSFRSISPIPVRWLPPCVPRPENEPLPRASLGLPTDAFLFYSAFDALSVPERKNPWAVLEALRRLMKREGVPRLHLLLKVNGTASAPELLDRLRAECADLPVTLVSETLSRGQVNGLAATADAFVSLHRSEGLGLHLIESMYLGKPVIATNYGGCTDFLDDSTGWPVAYALKALAEPQGPYPAGAVWAEPDVDCAVEAMAEVAAGGAAISKRCAGALARVSSLYAVEAAAPRIRAALEKAWSALAAPPAAAREDCKTVEDEVTASLVEAHRQETLEEAHRVGTYEAEQLDHALRALEIEDRAAVAAFHARRSAGLELDPSMATNAAALARTAQLEDFHTAVLASPWWKLLQRLRRALGREW
ncbi:MAG: glycosyltransferase [Acidobacteriota bacterium]